jgi:hypothetical protein
VYCLSSADLWFSCKCSRTKVVDVVNHGGPTLQQCARMGRDTDYGEYPFDSMDSEDFNAVSCSNKDIAHQGKIRVLSLIGIVMGVTELCVAIPIYEFLTNVKLGAWWSVVLIILAGLLSGVFGNARGWIVLGCILASMGTIVGGIGAATDAISGRIFNNLDLCAQPTLQGQTSLTAGFDFYPPNPATNSSAYEGVHDCFINQLSFHPVTTSSCYCTSVGVHTETTSTVNSCGYYVLSASAVAGGGNCGDIATTYAGNLKTSGILVMAATLVCFALSVVGCTSLCCSKRQKVTVFQTASLQEALVA